MSEFRLEKWYLDLADRSSERCFIGYAASLKWRKLHIGYFGFTFLNSKGEIETRNSFADHELAFNAGPVFEWKTEAFQGRWEQLRDPIRELLYQKGEKKIDWCCFQPLARAELNIGSERINGFGYCEKMVLSFLPWKLPIQQLYWGRFLNDQVSIIWIRWIGPVPKTLIFFNSQRFVDAHVSEFEVAFDHYRLSLTNSIALRSGTLESNVFEKVPLIAKLFPASIMGLHEQKWLSRGELFQNGVSVNIGKAIHELVTWA
jgi:hypothetical protein